MSIKTIEDDRLKTLFKSAFAEALEEHRDLVREIVGEAVEDIALARAIEQGLGGKPASRARVMRLLDAKR